MIGGDFKFVARHTHDTPDFLFELDEYRRADGDQRLVAHIRVHTFTKEVMKRILHEWRQLRKVITCPIYASPQDDTEKWAKFVSLLGFKPLQKILCNDGVERPLYIHTV